MPILVGVGSGWVLYWQGLVTKSVEPISSFPRLPVRLNINYPYLTNTIPHVTSAHLKHPKKCRFLQLAKYNSTPTSLFPLPSSLSCYPPLLSSLTINYGVFPLDSVRLSAVFPAEGKTPPVRRTTGPAQADTGLHSQNSSCSPGEVLFPSCLPYPLVVMWVGGL